MPHKSAAESDPWRTCCSMRGSSQCVKTNSPPQMSTHVMKITIADAMVTLKRRIDVEDEHHSEIMRLLRKRIRDQICYRQNTLSTQVSPVASVRTANHLIGCTAERSGRKYCSVPEPPLLSPGTPASSTAYQQSHGKSNSRTRC